MPHDPNPDLELLEAFATIRQWHRMLATAAREQYCPTQRRRRLATQRSVYRHALALILAQAEAEAEVSK